MFELDGKKIVIIGGTSGIGFAIARGCLERGAHPVIAGRSSDKLVKAREKLGENVTALPMDISRPEDFKSFYQKIGKFDHLVTPAANVSWGTFGTMTEKDEHASFQSKFWGQYYAAKYGFRYLNAGGSIVLFGGCWSRRPIPGAAIPSSINGAIESLSRALAVDLAPIRVNTISPGIINTPVFSGLSDQERNAFFEKTIRKLPIKKIGEPSEVAMTAIYLMTNTYTTGSTLYVDGGETLQ